MLNNIGKNKTFLLAGIVVYLAFKFSVISFLWGGRASPPMPADSILYITGLRDFIQFGDLSTIAYLSFVFLFGGIAKLFEISALHVYELQFYLGAVFSLFSICFLMFRLGFSGKSLFIACVLLAVMRIMPGSNFWIVPNYWSVYICLLFIGCNYGVNKNLTFSFLVAASAIVIFGAFFHRSFIFYSAGIFATLLTISVLLEGRDFNKRLLFSLFVSIVSYVIVVSSVETLDAAKVTAYIPSVSRNVVSFDHFFNSWLGTYNLSFYFLFSPVILLLVRVVKFKKLEHIDCIGLAAICCFIVFSFHYRTRGLLLLAPIMVIWFSYHIDSLVSKRVANTLLFTFFALNLIFLINHALRLNAINDVANWEQDIDIPNNASGVSVWPWMVPSLMKYNGYEEYRVNVWDQDVIKDKGVIVLLDPYQTYFSSFRNVYWSDVNKALLPLGCQLCNRILGLGYPHESLKASVDTLAQRKARKYDMGYSKLGDYGPVSVFQFHVNKPSE